MKRTVAATLGCGLLLLAAAGCSANASQAEVKGLQTWASSHSVDDPAALGGATGVATDETDTNAFVSLGYADAATVSGLRVICKGAKTLRVKIKLSTESAGDTLPPGRSVVSDPVPCDEQSHRVPVSASGIRTVTVTGVGIARPTGWVIGILGTQE